MKWIYVLIVLGSMIEPVFGQPNTGIQQTVWGQMPDGRDVHLFTLRNRAGMEVQITTYGGYLVSCMAPDRRGQFAPVTLGLPTLASTLR